jgi:phage terminase small subunit
MTNDVVPGELTLKQELFAQLAVKYGNQSRAYREAYDVGPLTGSATVWRSAVDVAQHPRVAARIDELERERCASVMFEARALVMDWVDIATADPNELIKHVHHNCRWCHGTDHAYQWRDADEYIAACVAAAQSDPPQMPPDDAGGYGFVGDGTPADDCPRCYGHGIGHTVLGDTTKLSRQARKLYKGVKVKGDGSIEVLMHDQEAARDALGRVAGIFKDGVPQLPNAKGEGDVIDAKANAVEASHEYLRLVR